MQAFGLARLGRDCEVRYTPSGEAVANLSLAFSWGKKGTDGKRATQWVEASLWGKRAEALSPYLNKGGLVAVSLEDVHIEEFKSRDGAPGIKLTSRIVNVELAGGGDRPAAAATRAPSTRAAATGTGFDDMDDDIPFILSLNEFSITPNKMRRMRRADF